MPITIAVPWYRREDYERIKEICERQSIYFTFDEWEAGANDAIEKMKAVRPDAKFVKVMVNPNELLKFAKDHGYSVIDGRARSHFAAITAAITAAKQERN